MSFTNGKYNFLTKRNDPNSKLIVHYYFMAPVSFTK